MRLFSLLGGGWSINFSQRTPLRIRAFDPVRGVAPDFRRGMSRLAETAHTGVASGRSGDDDEAAILTQGQKRLHRPFATFPTARSHIFPAEQSANWFNPQLRPGPDAWPAVSIRICDRDADRLDLPSRLHRAITHMHMIDAAIATERDERLWLN